MHFAGLGPVGAVLDGAFFDLRDFGRHPDHDSRPHPDVAVVRFLDEVGQHLSVTSKSAMTPSFIGLNRDDIPGRAPEHLLGIAADRFDPAVHLVDGHDRRLVDHNPFAARVDAGIGGSQIDGQVTRKQREHRTKAQQITPLTARPSVLAACCQRRSNPRRAVQFAQD